MYKHKMNEFEISIHIMKSEFYIKIIFGRFRHMIMTNVVRVARDTHVHCTIKSKKRFS